MTYAVYERDVAPQRVATIRERVPMSEVGKHVGAGFGEVARAAEIAHAKIDGMPFTIIHGPEGVQMDLELGFPVTGDVDVGRVHTSTMERARVAATLHIGPYSEVGPAYEALTTWIGEHHGTVTGPPREIYLNDPMTGDEPQTEIEMPFV
jgi:effector-binding domain-containing protein